MFARRRRRRARDQGAAGRAQRAGDLARQSWIRRYENLRRHYQHADTGAPRQERADLQQFSYRAALLAQPRGASHRPQLAQCQHGVRRGGRDRVSGPNRRTSPKRIGGIEGPQKVTSKTDADQHWKSHDGATSWVRPFSLSQRFAG